MRAISCAKIILVINIRQYENTYFLGDIHTFHYRHVHINSPKLK